MLTGRGPPGEVPAGVPPGPAPGRPAVTGQVYIHRMFACGRECLRGRAIKARGNAGGRLRRSCKNLSAPPVGRSHAVAARGTALCPNLSLNAYLLQWKAMLTQEPCQRLRAWWLC